MVKLSIRKLAKQLSPETLLRIQMQELDPKGIMHALINETFGYDALYESVGAVERAVIEAFGGKNTDVNNTELAIKLDALANYAIPGHGKSFDELRIKFMRACFRGAVDNFQQEVFNLRPGESLKFPDDEMMQAAFDRACSDLQSNIIRKGHGGKKKDFKRNCKAFRVPLADFSSTLETLYEKSLENHPFKEIRDSLPELYKIAKQIQDGNQLIDRLCWSCNEVTDCQRSCSKCFGARYCGAACQTKAWKGGHRFSCSSIKKIYENHVNNQSIIKAALADPKKHESLRGYRPNNRIDYMLMSEPFQRFPTDDGDEHFELPSMKQFYSNLSQVKNGLLWCDRPFAIPDIKSAVSLDFDDDAGLERVIRNGLALSHQYPDYSPDGTIENFKHRNSQLYSNWLTGITCIEEPNVDSNCTAAEFLKAYITWEHPQSYDRIFREVANSKAFLMMREYNKHEGSKRLMRNAVRKFIKKKRKVHEELHERHREKLRTRMEIYQKELASARKSLMHLELKALFFFNGMAQPTESGSTVDQNNLNCFIS